MFKLSRFKSAVSLAAVLSGSYPAFAQQQGPGTSGGGDNYTLDFVKTAHQVHSWLAVNGAKLSPAVDPDRFLLAVNPQDISSADRVFESCDGTQRGREVSACHNARSGKTVLSRTMYPLNVDAPSKMEVVAHEVFRKMGIEGDRYEITKQMKITQQDPNSAVMVRSMYNYFPKDLGASKRYLNDSINAAKSACFEAGFKFVDESRISASLIQSGPIAGNTPEEVRLLQDGFRFFYHSQAVAQCSMTKPVEQVQCFITDRGNGYSKLSIGPTLERSSEVYLSYPGPTLKKLDELVAEGRCTSPLASPLKPPKPNRCYISNQSDLFIRNEDENATAYIGTFKTFDKALDALDQYVEQGRCVSELSGKSTLLNLLATRDALDARISNLTNNSGTARQIASSAEKSLVQPQESPSSRGPQEAGISGSAR